MPQGKITLARQILADTALNNHPVGDFQREWAKTANAKDVCFRIEANGYRWDAKMKVWIKERR